MTSSFRSRPGELARKVARNPAILLRTTEKLKDVYKWRGINSKIDAYEQTHTQRQLLQVGVNDGLRGDPLHARIVNGGWSGLMVEPIAEHLREAQATYAEIPGLRFLQAALTDTSGVVPMYRFRHEKHRGVDVESHSLHREAIEKSAELLGIAATDEWVERIEVPAVTVATLGTTTDLEAIDLLAIDAEGSDAAILRQLLDTPVRPPLILYENLFMGAPEQAEIDGQFIVEGYQAVVTSQDTFLYR